MTTGCIEYWFVLHYEMYTPPIQTVAEKERVMTKLLMKEPHYKKGDEAITVKIGQNYPVIHLRRVRSEEGGTVIIVN